MASVIIIGHGGYGTGIKNNLEMIIGTVNNYYYIDFNQNDDLESLDKKINDTLLKANDDEILFACDLLGGSPFRQAALKCVENNKYVTVTGLSTAAFCEISFNLNLSIFDLAKLAEQTALDSIKIFPENI